MLLLRRPDIRVDVKAETAKRIEEESASNFDGRSALGDAVVERVRLGLSGHKSRVWRNFQTDETVPGRTSKKRLSLEVAECLFDRLLKFPTIKDHVSVVWHAGELMVLPPGYYDSMFALIQRLAKSPNRD